MENKIIYEQVIENDKPLLKAFKERINSWANNLPHHPYKNFGEKIEIKAIKYAPTYPIRMDTQYEKRSVQQTLMPYDGRKIPQRTYFKLEDLNAWKLKLNFPENFIDKTYNYVTTGSEHVTDCATCGAKGWLICSRCDGNIEITCPGCNGKGNETCSSCQGQGEQTCHNCNGKGKKPFQDRCTTCGGNGLVLNNGQHGHNENSGRYRTCPTCGGNKHINKEINCSTCGGRGRNRCSKCSGKGIIICHRCGGSRKITCPKCSGSGKNTCYTCNGKKQVMHYLNTKQELRKNRQESAMIHSVIFREFPEFEQNWSKYPGKQIFQTEQAVVEAGDLPEGTHLDKLFKPYMERSKAECAKGEKIIFQELKIFKIESWIVDYSYEEKSYRFVFYGPDYTLIPGKNPITKYAEELVHKGAEQTHKKNYVQAYKTIKKSADLNVYGQGKKIENRLSLLKEKITSAYMFGAQSIALIGAFIYGFLGYSYFLNYNHSLQWAYFLNDKEGFLFDFHALAMAVILAVVIYISGGVAGKIADKLFGLMPSAWLRFAFGALTAALWINIVAAIIIAVNITGLTVLVSLTGWLAWWLAYIIFMVIGIILSLIVWIIGLIF